MPRPSYYQAIGNPVQTDRLPEGQLQLQFAHTSDQSSTNNSFSLTILRNLYLVVFICLAGEWINVAFRVMFPLNILLVIVVIRGMIKLWQVTDGYKPNLLLLAVPFVAAFVGVPFQILMLCALITAAIAGRQLARHYVYLSTNFPMPPGEAASVRSDWDGLTVASALLVIVPGMMVLHRGFAIAGIILLIVYAVACLGNAATKGNSLSLNLAVAWNSWCSYNRDDVNAPGLMSSPAGTLSVRLGLTVLLVSLVTILITAGTGVAELAFGDIAVGDGLPRLIFGFVIIATVVGFPVAISLGLMFLVALPALSSLRVSRNASSAAATWQTITETIQSSPNPVERESVFMGRLSHDGSPFLVPRTVLREHAHILGDSGSGKTARGLIPLAEQLVADGQSSLMVIDLKGDSQEILQSLRVCSQRAAGLGLQLPVKQFSIREDHATFAFNPFQMPCWTRLNDFQRTDVLCGALGLTYGTDYGRGFFSSANAAVLYATLKNFPRIASFAELSDRIAFVTSKPKVYELNDGQSDAGNHVKMIAARLAGFKALNITPQQSPSADIAAEVMDPAQLFQRQEIHYFHLSSTLGPGASPEIARLAMFMLLTSATLMEQRRQVYLMIDEFQRVAAHNVDAILQIARSMNVGVILANQSMLDLKRDDLVHVVEANCRFRQWYAVSSPEEQERLSKASGQTVEVLLNESTSRQSDGFEVRTTVSKGATQFIAPRLSLNDIKLASDDPRKSIALVTRGAGYCQYGGMPVVVESDFHISEQEFLARRNAAWPAVGAGSFVPNEWNPVAAAKAKVRKPRGPVITEETIGDESGLFDAFLTDQKR